MGEGIKKMVHGFSSTASLSCDSGDSIVSSSSSDLTEDATSSSPDGPLYDLSSLMSHLPIKRGLSKFYQGKSQSFVSLCNAVCVGDLAKKVSPYRRKMKPTKSYVGLDARKKTSCTLRPYSKTMSKKPTRVPGFHVLL